MEAKKIDFSGFEIKFPTMPQKWSVAEMCEFLKEYNLSQFIQTFSKFFFLSIAYEINKISRG